MLLQVEWVKTLYGFLKYIYWLKTLILIVFQESNDFDG